MKRLTGGKGLQVVYDAVGKTTFDKGFDCLAPARHDGALRAVERPRRPVRSPGAQRQGLAVPHAPEPRPPHRHARRARSQRAGDVLGWIRDGKLTLRIEFEFPLKDAAEAHRALEGREDDREGAADSVNVGYTKAMEVTHEVTTLDCYIVGPRARRPGARPSRRRLGPCAGWRWGQSRGSRSYSAPAKPSSPASPTTPSSPSRRSPAGLAGRARASELLRRHHGRSRRLRARRAPRLMLFGGLGGGLGGLGGGIGMMDILLIGGGRRFFMFLRRRKAQAQEPRRRTRGWAAPISAGWPMPAPTPTLTAAPVERVGRGSGAGTHRPMDGASIPTRSSRGARSVLPTCRPASSARDTSRLQDKVTPEHARASCRGRPTSFARPAGPTSRARRSGSPDQRSVAGIGTGLVTVYLTGSLLDYTVDDAHRRRRGRLQDAARERRGVLDLHRPVGAEPVAAVRDPDRVNLRGAPFSPLKWVFAGSRRSCSSRPPRSSRFPGSSTFRASSPSSPTAPRMRSAAPCASPRCRSRSFRCPVVTLHKLEVAEDPQFRRRPVPDARQRSLAAALRPLLTGRVEFAELVLAKPVITVIRDPGGRLNVASLGASPEPRPAPRAPRPSRRRHRGAAAPILLPASGSPMGCSCTSPQGGRHAPYRVERLDLTLDAAPPQVGVKGSARVTPGDGR